MRDCQIFNTLLHELAVLSTHVVQYQSFTETQSKSKNETHNQKYLDGELFRKGPTSLLEQY